MNKEQVNWSRYRKVPILEVKLCDDDIALDPAIASLVDARLKRRNSSMTQRFDRTMRDIVSHGKSKADQQAANLESKPTLFLADSSLVISQLLAYMRARASGSRESLVHVLARYPSDTRVDVFEQKSGEVGPLPHKYEILSSPTYEKQTTYFTCIRC